MISLFSPPPGAATTPPPTTPPPTTMNPNPNCQQCSIYFQYINAYYWPTDNTNNTACLSGVTEQPSTALPSGLTPYVPLHSHKERQTYAYPIFSISPSVYLVFPTISAGNECTQVGNVYISQTLSFAPGALSTMVGTSGVVQPFNFEDLPCPPPDVAAADNWFYNPSWNPGRAYSPMVSPPPEIFALDPAFADCVAAVYQGFDPPYPMPTQHGGGNWGGGGGGWRKKRSAPAHLVARIPDETGAPALVERDPVVIAPAPYHMSKHHGDGGFGSGGWKKERRAPEGPVQTPSPVA